MAQADAADSATLDGLRGQLDALSGQIKQASAILIPLSKQATLLNQYRHNLKNWHDAVKVQSRDALRSLGVRLGILLAILGVVFALAHIWHRAVLKYVQDARRRYQLLLLRKIALWSLVVVIVGFTFASELSSIVTFAGLITAGLAVAMQSVLVSIVGYFFLIGKYGIRVGDRVQIGEVSGEVIELGMVRMYLMEFAGQGSASPTGRVAAFPNSVVFQVSAGLFKQIPGVNFAWHDITLGVPAGADYSQVKERLFAAANEALGDYREEIQRQTRELQADHLVERGRGGATDGAAGLFRERRGRPRSLSGSSVPFRRNRRTDVQGTPAGDFRADPQGSSGRSVGALINPGWPPPGDDILGRFVKSAADRGKRVSNDSGHRCRQYPPEMGVADEHGPLGPAGRGPSRCQAGHVDRRVVRGRTEAPASVDIQRRRSFDGERRWPN